MRKAGTLRASAAIALAVVGGVVLLPGAALGSHRPTVEQVVGVATSETWAMGCEPTGGSIECSASDFDFTWFERATIRPGSGSLTDLETAATVRTAPLDSYFQGWHRALQAVACAPDDLSARQLIGFIAGVAGLREAGEVAPLTIPGECLLTGGLTLTFSGEVAQYTYWVRSAVLSPPSPTPSPTSSPIPTPSLNPSPSPSPTATSASATPTPTPSATPSVTPGPSASGSSSAAPATSAAESASPSAGGPSSGGTEPSPTPSTEQEVAGGNPTPTAAPGDQSPVNPEVPGSPQNPLLRSVVGAAGVSLEPGAIAQSALLALVLLLFMGFAGELFNSTLESNYDEVAGWFGIVAGPMGRVARFWRGPLGIVAFLAVGALVYALLDPGLGPDIEALATYLGLLIGLVVVLASFELPGVVLYRRRTGEIPRIRALPWTLPAAALCVLLSRAVDLQPAYLYGILLGLVFAREPSPSEEGRQAAAGALWTLAVAIVAWLGLDWVRGGGLVTDGPAALVAETALAVIVVGGLEAVALGLLPMRFLAGAAIYRWRRAVWAALFVTGAFTFLHLLVGPQSGYLAELDPGAMVVACVAFVAFGTLSVAFWAYFRYRPSRLAA